MSKPYWWFRGASVEALVKRLVAADPATCTLEVRISDEQKMTFRVVPKDTAALGDGNDPPDINDSHLCPPDCS